MTPEQQGGNSSMRAEGCVFASTPTECSMVIDNKCNAVESHKLGCVSNYRYEKIHPEMVNPLMGMFREELRNSRRFRG